MYAYQWFLLGIMVAYTPSMIILAFMLRDMEVDGLGEVPAYLGDPSHQDYPGRGSDGE
jgi:hypothetical protein